MFRLRELERRDLTEIIKWRNDPELINLLGAPFRYINYDVDVQWFENYMKSRNNAVRCAIVGDDDNIIGLVSLVPVDMLNQSAEFHIMIYSVIHIVVKGIVNRRHALLAFLRLHRLHIPKLRQVMLQV